MPLITRRPVIDPFRLSPGVQYVLEIADNYSAGQPVTIEHLVRAVLDTDHEVSRALRAMGVTAEALDEELAKQRK